MLAKSHMQHLHIQKKNPLSWHISTFIIAMTFSTFSLLSDNSTFSTFILLFDNSTFITFVLRLSGVVFSIVFCALKGQTCI